MPLQGARPALRLAAAAAGRVRCRHHASKEAPRRHEMEAKHRLRPDRGPAWPEHGWRPRRRPRAAAVAAAAIPIPIPGGKAGGGIGSIIVVIVLFLLFSGVLGGGGGGGIPGLGGLGGGAVEPGGTLKPQGDTDQQLAYIVDSIQTFWASAVLGGRQGLSRDQARPVRRGRRSRRAARRRRRPDRSTARRTRRSTWTSASSISSRSQFGA